jgi:hypothetical protein
MPPIIIRLLPTRFNEILLFASFSSGKLVHTRNLDNQVKYGWLAAERPLSKL